MKLVIQRVTHACVTVEGETVGKIGKGFLVLIGVGQADSRIQADALMKKMIGLIAFFIAIGMLLMLLTHNRLVGLVIIALLLFLGYNCFCSD